MGLSKGRALVTGGGSGIGLELAGLPARRNTVCIAGRDAARLKRARDFDPALLVSPLHVVSEHSARVVIDLVRSELRSYKSHRTAS